MKNDIANILSCPYCLSKVSLKEGKIICSNRDCNATFDFSGGIYRFFRNAGSRELELSLEKWDSFYADKLREGFYNERYIQGLEKSHINIINQMNEYKRISKDTIFLEIGCGPMFLGRYLSRECKYVIGIDISLTALKLAKKLFDAKGIKNYVLIQADLKRMPISSDLVDLVYGGGVLEHSRDIEGPLREIYRVLRKKGVSFNTVPHLNLGSLTYRQLWGNIPNFPILREVAYFIHAKLLGARHMSFGYELSFSARFMEKLHRRVGFRTVYIDKFDTELVFEFIPFAFIRRAFSFLANNSPLFWPMIKVVGEK